MASGDLLDDAVPDGTSRVPTDSERFRSVPRTCGPPYARLETRDDGAGNKSRTSESARLMELAFSGGFAMAFTSYLGDFDVDAETNRVIDVALEMTRAALGLAERFCERNDRQAHRRTCQGRRAASRSFM